MTKRIYQHFSDHDYVYSVNSDFMPIDCLKINDKVIFMNKDYLIRDIKPGSDGIHFYLERFNLELPEGKERKEEKSQDLEIKGCPWCQEKLTIFDNISEFSPKGGVIGYEIGCGNDDCDFSAQCTLIFSTRQEAISAWNNRNGN